jgi:DNA-binding NtrC family response regulator
MISDFSLNLESWKCVCRAVIYCDQGHEAYFGSNRERSKYMTQEVQIMNANAKQLYRSLNHSMARPKNQVPSAVLTNKLEALKILANSILSEVTSMETVENQSHTDVDLAEEVQKFEEDLIRTALTRTHGRQRRAAALLGVKPTTLHAKMKRYGMIEEAEEHG